MGNIDKLITLMHSKNELEQVRQRTRQKLIRLRRHQFHIERNGFDAKNPPRSACFFITTQDKVRPNPYLVPLYWIKATRNERKYQIYKAQTEAMVAAQAVRDFTREHGKTIAELMKKESIQVHRCRYNHYYENVYRIMKPGGAREWMVQGRKDLERRALKIVAEQILIGGSNG